MYTRARIHNYRIQLRLTMYFSGNGVSDLAKRFSVGNFMTFKSGFRRKSGEEEKLVGRASVSSDAQTWESGVAEHWENIYSRTSEIETELLALRAVADRCVFAVVVDDIGKEFPVVSFGSELGVLLARFQAEFVLNVTDRNE